MGPVWDFDLAFGNAYAYRSMDTNGWRWTSAVGIQYKWFMRLFEDPDFLQRYIDRWAELRRSVFATSNVMARVDRLAAELKDLGQYADGWRFQRLALADHLATGCHV